MLSTKLGHGAWQLYFYVFPLCLYWFFPFLTLNTRVCTNYKNTVYSGTSKKTSYNIDQMSFLERIRNSEPSKH